MGMACLSARFANPKECASRTTGGEVWSHSSNSPEATVSATANANGDEVNLDDPMLTLVNPTHPLPEDWQTELVDIGNGKQIDSRAYDGLTAMLDSCRDAGYAPMVCSAYRTYEKQLSLYENKLQRCYDQGLSGADAEREAAFWVAKPNTSEHQLGLAVDIVSWENQRLDDTQLDSPAQQWLMAHCWEYGFIFRYQADKTEWTQVGHEPWHYRYVGRAAAKQIGDWDVCLEEYLELLANA
ncbi:MAG: M15 family metallopeptidase [Clostridia bacterium]|nr:M15 family metallopeptidase [Clostridia bacterium]